ncbi:MAG: F0F1 ATP synthase subunit A [Bacteroidota bacterium]
MSKSFISIPRLFLLAVLAASVLLSHNAFAQDGHNHDGHDHSQHQHDGHDHSQHNHDGHDHAKHEGHSHGNHGCGGDGDGPYDPVATAMHHISDANEFHVLGDFHIPLPVILYAPDQGLTTGLSSMFHHGHTAVDGYVLDHGRVKRVKPGQGFPTQAVDHDCITHEERMVMVLGKEKKQEVGFVEYKGKKYELESSSTLDGGLFGGGFTSYYDFSITRNVFAMLLCAIILVFLFLRVAKGYKDRKGMAPKGLQSFMEPFFTFIRDEVSIPMIGEKHYERFQPFVMSLFFFVLILNLTGLVPFFPGGSNVTGNLAVTMALALLTFIITTVNGNKHYWEHILWMPGIPGWVKIVLTPVEVLGMFIKPFSLMIRLFANITAGHIIILSLIGLIFIFGDNGNNVGGATAGGVVGVAFTAFMNLIELIVAFIQAFIFATLSASYIGAAVEEAHEHH